MTHIVVVSTSFPDSGFQKGQEAAGSFVYDFVMELAKHASVTAVVPSKMTNIEVNENLTIRRFQVPSLPLSLLKPTNPTQWQNILKTLRSGETAVHQAVLSKPTHHIFALWTLPSGYWAKKAAQTFNIPYSIWALGSDIWGLGRIPLIRNVLRSVLQDSQECFADGYQLAQDVTLICGRECHFLPSSRKLPVPTPKELASSPPYKLAFLGRWHPNKGIDILLESLDYLNEEDWERIQEIRIYGGGPLADLVTEKCTLLQENNRPISCGGYLNRQEATDLLLWTDYLLLPSRIESIPVIFSDALQCQSPIISTPIGDLPRLLTNNQLGILAEEVTSKSFSHAIKMGLTQSPLKYASDINHISQQFTVTHAVSQFLLKSKTKQSA